ncbi:MAG: macrolide ABC transporter ATP-binding protein [Sulfobacillus acidophilus]|uniref:Macrolide ABC transporter ATP-binding protein n=1 Tax=Sulfobacillus acidophilus TaxID=53633 RepID=A0A2T2WLL0_9FIRM|nr:MAG: macrolide ABC transporter ATP-binding protein [Sulfobacillus acidophilus]
MLLLRDISKVYQGRSPAIALQGINLTLPQGEFLAVVGSSGSGKSTLLNILGLLDRPTTGEYWIDGTRVRGWSDARLARMRNETLGFVYQSFNLIPTLSARENVELPLVYRQVPPKERRHQVDLWLERVRLSDRMHHYPAELSGGQQQRVAVARALVHNPKVLFADEPTANLDGDSTDEIVRVFDEVHASGQTIVLITHDRYFAQAADRVVKLAHGRLVSEAVTRRAN